MGLEQGIIGDNSYLFEAYQQEVEGFLQDIRSRFPNKALIFDIWATWCSPCISDMKNSKEIKEEIADLPVEIIYLCVPDRSNLETWKQKIAEYEVAGQHIFLNKNLAAKFMDFFKLRGYPSYLFIDKEGNLDKGFVKRISSIDVEELKKKL